MKPGKYDLVIYENATFELPLVWGPKGGSPYDLTGWSAVAQIRPSADSSVVLSEMSTANGRITIDPLAGKITLKLQPADTDMKWDKGVWDLKVITPAGDEYFLLTGGVSVIHTVTR